MASERTIAKIIALFQASYPTRSLTKERLSLAAIAYQRALHDLSDEAVYKAAHIAVRDDDSSYRDWPSPGQVRAIAERLLGMRVSGYEAVRLAAERIRSQPDGAGDYRYTVNTEGLSQPVASTLKESLRRFGIRRFAEMPEDRRNREFAALYEETARELRAKWYAEALPGALQQPVLQGVKEHGRSSADNTIRAY